MKKYLTITVSVALTLLSCSKETPVVNENTSDSPFAFNLAANHPDVATKAVKTGWESGDVIFVFFSGKEAPAYLEMKWDGTKWETTAKNSLSLANGETGTMRAVFLPFGSAATVTADGSSFKFNKVYYSYYLTASLQYSVSDNSVSGTFDMRIPEGYVQFFVDEAGAKSTDVTELREPNLTPCGVVSVASDGSVNTETLAHGAPLPGYVYDKEEKESGESLGYLFSGILSDNSRNTATDYHFTFVKGGWYGTYYSKAFSNKTFYRGESAGRAVKLPALRNWENITDGYEPVDLGIENDGKRIYWCVKNLGAQENYNSGDYYAWGETEPYYSSLDPLTWKAGKEYGYDTPSYSTALENKYTRGDVTLQPADDAARVKLGGIWRTPTKEELEALVAGCTLSWVDDFFIGQSTGVPGYRFISKTSSAWIFIPAAGSYFKTSISSNTKGYAELWTAFCFNNRLAHEFFFSKRGTGFTYNDDKFYGDNIRPVTD